MRIGLYGLPTAGKTYILESITNIEVLHGSKLLKDRIPSFYSLCENEKKQARTDMAIALREKCSFIMDGHYAFGDNIVFTEADGELYDVFLYLYIAPEILQKRISESPKNSKYAKENIAKWQMEEIQGLRDYCHAHDKDFYVIDNPEEGYFRDITMVLSFITAVQNGYSCVDFARQCVEDILKKSYGDTRVKLFDGDKTITIEDTSSLLGYKTRLFDGNFYSGFQAWRHHYELRQIIEKMSIDTFLCNSLDIHYNQTVYEQVGNSSYILTSGSSEIWKHIAESLECPFFNGEQMSADTKYFITKYLKDAGKTIIAYGDSMNDYYMLLCADEGYLVAKQDGTISRSLRNKSLEGITIVNCRKN